MSMTTNKKAVDKQALISKIKKQTESFDTVVLREEEANALLDELEAAERRNAELMERLAKLIDILDWHTIELGWGEKPITLAELIVAREGADSLSSFRAAATDKGE